MSEVDQDAIIELVDDEGNNLEFEHLLTFEYDDELFVAFTPIEDMEDYGVGEVLIMRLKQDDSSDEDIYLPIDSQEELDILWDVFQELYYEDPEEEEDVVEIDEEEE